MHEYNKRYYASHSDREKSRASNYRSENVEKVRAGLKQWRESNVEHRQAYNEQYYAKHKEEIKAYQRERMREMRRQVIKHYGGRCVCCGTQQYEFLAIDHINNDGVKHRKEVGMNIVPDLIKRGFPVGFQILCHNCNSAKGFYGHCPHLDHPTMFEVGGMTPEVV